MLGNQIGPIEWTLVIRQVARQPLPRVIPEKTCIEVSHCYRQDQDTHLYLLEHSTDGLTPYSCNTLMIGLTLQSALADWWCLHWIPEPVDPSVYTGLSRCRRDNSLLWDLPTESSFRGQSISP